MANPFYVKMQMTTHNSTAGYMEQGICQVILTIRKKLLKSNFIFQETSMKLLVDVDQIRSWEVSKVANIPIITYGFHSFLAFACLLLRFQDSSGNMSLRGI